MEKISPTRMNLLMLKERMTLAQNGLELLRSKRQALMGEFLKISGRVLEDRGRLRNIMEGAMKALTVAMGLDGREGVESAAMAAKRDLAVELEERNVWGVRFPELKSQMVVRPADGRNYSIAGVSSHTNAAAGKFEQVLEKALQIIPAEVRLRRIGGEIKKTSRRVNAVNEILLPRFRRQVRLCRLALDEREREEVFRIKRFKKEREAGQPRF